MPLSVTNYNLIKLKYLRIMTAVTTQGIMIMDKLSTSTHYRFILVFSFQIITVDTCSVLNVYILLLFQCNGERNLSI